MPKYSKQWKRCAQIMRVSKLWYHHNVVLACLATRQQASDPAVLITASILKRNQGSTISAAGLCDADELDLFETVMTALRSGGKDSMGRPVPEVANAQKLLDGVNELQRGEPAHVPVAAVHTPSLTRDLLARCVQVYGSDCRLPEHVLPAGYSAMAEGAEVLWWSVQYGSPPAFLTACKWK